MQGELEIGKAHMKLLILGAGEYGRLVKELARNKYTTIDFLDDKSDVAIGKFEDYRKLKDIVFY